MEILDIISALFTSAWGLFTGIQVPGLDVSFASWFIALLLAGIAVKAVRYVFGFGGSGTGYRSGRSGKKYIPQNRKDDER